MEQLSIFNFNPSIINSNISRVCSHGLSISVPLCRMLHDSDEPWFNIVYVIAKMLVQRKGDGSKYFVVFHIFQIEE